jgi:hypothetical protein
VIVFSVLILGFAVQYCSAATPSVIINESAYFTNSTTVTLTLNASAVLGSPSDPDTQMCINNDNLTWTNWESYSSSVTWLLTDGDGEKTVYVSFRLNSTSLSSDASSSNITLDTTPPVLSLVTPSSNLTDINSSTLQVEWTATDSGSGLNRTEIALDNGAWIDVGTNTTQVFTELTNGAHTLDIKPSDNVGNYQTTSISFDVNIVVPTILPPITASPTTAPTSSPTLAPTPSPTVMPVATPALPWIYFLIGGLVAAFAIGMLFVRRRRKQKNAIEMTSSGSFPSNPPKDEPSESSTNAPSSAPIKKRDHTQDSTVDELSRGGVEKGGSILDSDKGSGREPDAIQRPRPKDSDEKPSRLSSKSPKKMREGRLESVQAILPRIDRVEPQTLEFAIDAKVLIRGDNLKANKVLIRLGQTEPVAPLSNDISDNEISIALPKEMEIGVNTIQVIHQGIGNSGDVQGERLSNVSLFVLAPKIIEIVPTPIPRGNDLTISFEPMGAPLQQVTVLIGDAQFPLTLGRERGNKVSLKIPRDFPVGTYLIRVRIGGADSFIHGDLTQVTIE